MKFSAKITGSKKINDSIAARIKAHSQKSVENLTNGVLLIHSEAVKNLQSISPGKTQIRYGPKRTVKVSKPGDPPNTDTGTAIKSIGFNIDTKKLTGEVGTDLKYLKFLELGTKTIAARPWLIVALKKVKKELRLIFRKTPKVK